MGAASDICRALVDQSRASIAASLEADRNRPVGTIKIDMDFYSAAEAKKPREDYDFHAHGRHYKGSGSRWAVFRYRWDGFEWKRTRRLTGPLQFTDALDRRTELAAKAKRESSKELSDKHREQI